MDKLAVPFGVNSSGKLISIKDAISSEKYKCPACDSELIYRAGPSRVKHFSHPSSSSCSAESITHITAKRLIHRAIQENADGKLPIELQNHCYGCEKEFFNYLPEKTFDGAGQEVQVGTFKCDVVGYRDAKICLAIEVFHTHAVDEYKAHNLSVYWVELKAEDIIDDYSNWKPTQSHLKNSLCNSCKDHKKRINAIADKWNIDRALYKVFRNELNHNYIGNTVTCFNCKEDIPVFWWKGVPFSEEKPIEPKPHTIKLKNSKQYGGAYWANICPNCSALQGDNFIFLFDSSPFKGLPLREQEPKEVGTLKVTSGPNAVSMFMDVIKRNI